MFQLSQNIQITETAFDPEVSLATFRRSLKNTGAIVSFAGIVRDDADALILSHYPGFTEQEIVRIATLAQERWSLTGYAITHRVGEMLPGDVIVCVATASAHRRAAFEAADFIMDHLKSEAPFWKQEKKSDELAWIEPRKQDGDDIKRWSK